MYTPSGVAASWPLGRKVCAVVVLVNRKPPVEVVAKVEI